MTLPRATARAGADAVVADGLKEVFGTAEAFDFHERRELSSDTGN